MGKRVFICINSQNYRRIIIVKSIIILKTGEKKYENENEEFADIDG